MLLLKYYNLRLKCSVFDFESRVRNIPIERDIEGFCAFTEAAMESLRFLVERLYPAGIITFSPDLVTLYSAKLGFFLTKVSMQQGSTVHKATAIRSSNAHAALALVGWLELAKPVLLTHSSVVSAELQSTGRLSARRTQEDL